VILVTLVGQGLLLPVVIRALGLANAGRREHQADAAAEFHARRQAVAAASARLEQLASARTLPQAVVAPLRAGLQDRLNNLEHRIDGNDGHKRLVDVYDDLELTLLAAERDVVNDLYRDGQLKDEARRRIERELDLREAALENLRSAQ
jgi:CPA1 family monovalent cation:H+ antiporter